MQFRNGNIHWNIFFTRLMRDCEVEVVSDFFELFSQRVRQGGEDKMSWIPSTRNRLK
jgi:adenosine deaminase